ncbi:hypothetical protein PoB_004404100 [Plakobranchus ocellatus]|uniref:Uncharacterized protein n=1 Tax=Plakobranchus ocellatus TaxID=259542 RepID=A0AAV4BFF3_9GAST|nr:hypothetical protein PoB_004404100 [Plakobranchus ocellatus]
MKMNYWAQHGKLIDEHNSSSKWCVNYRGKEKWKNRGLKPRKGLWRFKSDGENWPETTSIGAGNGGMERISWWPVLRRGVGKARDDH